MVSSAKRLGFPFVLALLLLAASRGAFAQSSLSAEDPAPPSPAQPPAASEAAVANTGPIQFDVGPQRPPLTDLTLGNFFSAGWNDDFAMRTRATGTPDLTLLRVQPNLLLQLFRTNFFEQTSLASATRKDLTDLDGFIDWSFNRRCMLEVNDAYQWIDPRTGSPSASGGAPGILSRIQLVDTESSSYCFNFKALAPNTPLGTTQTTLTYSLAGFEDLGYWFQLERVGLYYSLTFDSFCGPVARGTRQNDVQYCVALAKTITDTSTPNFLTLFVENFGQTDLDGTTAGRTLFSITPGVRLNFNKVGDIKLGGANSLLFGTDIPVSEYRPWDATYRLSYIKCF